MLKFMSLAQLANFAQMIAAVGVIASLVFVGLQIRHNTAALQRNEHNSTMAQWTVAEALGHIHLQPSLFIRVIRG